MVVITTTQQSRKASAASKIKAIIVNVPPRPLALLFAVGATCTIASNLRQRRALFQQDGHDDTKPSSAATAEQYMISPAVSASIDSNGSADEAAVVDATASIIEPSIALDKSTYSESESIAVSFSVGSPSHPYYSTSDTPTLNLDYNYPQWSVGLFMRDADPQGGTHSPIVSVNVCGAMGEGCDANDRNFASYNDLSVTFGIDHLDLMHGQWPLEVSRYGTGFDAYVLDGKGAAAIGPLEFYIQSEEDEDASNPAQNAVSVGAASNPLLKYRKGTKRATERQHANVSKGSATVKAKVKIGRANVLKMSSNSILSEEAAETTKPSRGRITSDKEEYEHDESVSISFSLPARQDLSSHRIGIFMRMANPQGGALEPVVSLPLCSNKGPPTCATTDGAVKFSQESTEHMMPEGSTWPIDLYQWGTGFDAYVLNESGDDVAGPVKFNIKIDDTS